MKFKVGEYIISKFNGRVLQIVDCDQNYSDNVYYVQLIGGTSSKSHWLFEKDILYCNKFFRRLYGLE